MMTEAGMATAIQNSGINGCTDAASALSLFWGAICKYVSSNAVATYSWAGAGTVVPPIDPIVMLTCKVVATPGVLTPCMATDAASAMSAMSAQMNTLAATWTVVPDISTSPGFVLTPGFIIPTIVLTQSNETEPTPALLSVCRNIVAGIKSATPILTGTHLAYTGTATLISIL